MGYKFLEHTADLKIQVSEKTIEEAFSSSALAMKEAMCGKIKIKSLLKKKVFIESKDYERLLYDFLEQFLYLLDAQNFIISQTSDLKIEKDLCGFKLSCFVFGDKASKYKFTNSIKAITYNQMLVSENSKSNTVIQFVVDV